MPTVELRFGALPEHVRTARLVAAAVARRGGVGAAVVDEVKLAVGEACARAVMLHRRAAPAELVTVLLTDDTDGFVVEVVDAGPSGADLPPGLGFPDGSAAPPAGALDVATVDDGHDADVPPGLGLAVIAGLVEDVTVTPAPGRAGTTVRMAWPHAADRADGDPDVDLDGDGYGDPGSSALDRPAPTLPEQAPAP